jgi:hypothetical protein
MPKQIPPQHPRDAYRRKAIKQRVLGINPECECGESRLEALITSRKPTICMACDRRARGISERDDHHIAGRTNSQIVINVPVNDHEAELSMPQRDWPKKTLENPDGSPLLSAAAHVRGFVDTIIYLIQKLLLWIASLLELLDTTLEEKMGKKYWKGTNLEAFEPKD